MQTNCSRMDQPQICLLFLHAAFSGAVSNAVETKTTDNWNYQLTIVLKIYRANMATRKYIWMHSY